MLITKEEAIAKYGRHRVFSWQNGDWEWTDQDNWVHLMRLIDGEWVELTKGLEATWIWSYPNGDWEWKDQEKWMHLMRWVDSKWIELTKGIKATYVWSYLNGDWGWRDQHGKEHEGERGNNMTITKEEAIAKYGEDMVVEYPNGDWSYNAPYGWKHLMRKINGEWIELTKGLEAVWVYSYGNGDWKWEDQDGNLHQGKGEIE